MQRRELELGIFYPIEDLEKTQSTSFLADHLRILINDGPRKELILWQTAVLLDQVRFAIIWLTFSVKENPDEGKRSLSWELYCVHKELTSRASSIENKEKNEFQMERSRKANSFRRHLPSEREIHQEFQGWNREKLVEKSQKGLSLLKKFDQLVRGEDLMDQVADHLKKCASYEGYDILNRMVRISKIRGPYWPNGERILDYLKKFFLAEAELSFLEEDFKGKYSDEGYPDGLSPEALHCFLQTQERQLLSQGLFK